MAEQPVETLTAEQQTTFRNEIDALKNDVESVLALLAGETFETEIQLSDTSALVRPAGRIGGTADGKGMVVHDGERTGGVPVPVGFDHYNLRGGVLVPNASVVAGDVLVEIGRLRPDESWYMNNQLVYVFAEILVNGTTYAGTEISVGFHFDGQTDLIAAFDNGTRLFVASANFSVAQKISSFGQLLISEASDLFQINGGSIISGVRSPVGVANSALGSVVSTSVPQDGCVTGGDLIVTARVAQDAAKTGDPIYVYADLKIALP